MLTDTILRNRYKILKELGRGGFSVTYLAVDMDLPGNPKCVVKQLKTRQSNSTILQIAKKLFEREAQVLYRLGKAHKQIPEMLAHFEENEEFYLVQEFVDGHDLTREIKQRHRLSEEKVIKLLQGILEVLSFVHENKVIHRDIKLRNIMRRRQDGKIVLIDFGAVKEIKGLARNQQGDVNSTLIIGTPGYMPDEQANGKPRLCSDVYAVGMLGIQALTGISPRELPFNPDNGELIWRNSADISDRLAEVLTGMVRHHFSQRYQTAAEALKALKSPVIILPKANPANDALPDTLASTIRKSRPAIPSILQTFGLLGLMGVGFGLGVFGWSAIQSSSNANKPTLNTREVRDTVLKKIKPSTTPKVSQNEYPKIFLPSTPRVVDSKTKPVFLPFIPFLNDDRIQRTEETSQSISKDKRLKSPPKSKPKPIQPKNQPNLKTSIVKEEKSNSIPKFFTPKPKNNQEYLPPISTSPYKDKEIENSQTSLPSTPLKEDKQNQNKEENSDSALPTPTPSPTPSQSESIDKQNQNKEENSDSPAPTPIPSPSQSESIDKQTQNKEENSDSPAPTPTPSPSQSESIDKQNQNKEENSDSPAPTPTPPQSESKENQVPASPSSPAIEKNEPPSPKPTLSPVPTEDSVTIPTNYSPPKTPEGNSYKFIITTPTPRADEAEIQLTPTPTPTPSADEAEIKSNTSPTPTPTPTPAPDEEEIQSNTSPTPTADEVEIEMTPQAHATPAPDEEEIQSNTSPTPTADEVEIEMTPQAHATPAPDEEETQSNTSPTPTADEVEIEMTPQAHATPAPDEEETQSNTSPTPTPTADEVEIEMTPQARATPAPKTTNAKPTPTPTPDEVEGLSLESFAI